MRVIIAAMLLALSAITMAHDWPTSLIPEENQPANALFAGLCSNDWTCAHQNLTSQGRAALNSQYCISGGCAPAQGTYHEVHIAKYTYGYLTTEFHFIYRMIEWNGVDYFQLIAYHDLGGAECGQHELDQNLGW